MWRDVRNGIGDIYLYDLDTEVEIPICTDSSEQIYPSISGNKIVWVDNRNGNADIYLYDLDTGVETPICIGLKSEQIYPSISGNKIVWEDNL